MKSRSIQRCIIWPNGWDRFGVFSIQDWYSNLHTVQVWVATLDSCKKVVQSSRALQRQLDLRQKLTDVLELLWCSLTIAGSQQVWDHRRRLLCFRALADIDEFWRIEFWMTRVISCMHPSPFVSGSYRTSLALLWRWPIVGWSECD